MACWLIADEGATRAKIAAAHRLGVPLVTGGGPFEIAEDRGRLESFLELVASFDIDRIEAGEGFPKLRRAPRGHGALAGSVGVAVQVGLGGKHARRVTP